ncbi:2-succinyl-5-enolpyruvyl-6-hydroxy-3-cyclohexene-1-carboxylic-acid synthase [Halalkalibacillus halophilus]|uniref:2-succinyl-5-enolpyruvyl-6-hydroxy-3- cyclohexene-1-carboxylic-acid synthase n=1 Tax=Halalkalibacillus halophilus TaxID=392827 RepID=UPI000405615B|nr:2-succinyl-5-enolpyruvyl-6-hydroxy-3-cyclohexene-1-carboxylic-acid synthase [Halalkalibacillus halophilus]
MTMEANTYYVSYFIDELYKSGVENVVISPGSRSTSLAMLASEHPNMKEWVHFDERSAAFFALGIAKVSQTPVVLICTSGTAAANYYPAVVEAYYSRIPLIILTADRPHELRDNGAPQAIDQFHMYGNYAKKFFEMALPESDFSMLTYSRRQASRACQIANSSHKGVVQVNFPFRDPLIPELELPKLWGESEEAAFLETVPSIETISNDYMDQLAKRIPIHKRIVIACGELVSQEELIAIKELADAWEVPIFADVLSNVRQLSHSHVISSFDVLLKNEELKKLFQANVVIRFGSMPVSKAFNQWLTKYPPDEYLVIDQDAGYREPTGNRATLINSEISPFVKGLLKQVPVLKNTDSIYTAQLQEADKLARNILEESTQHELTEGAVANVLAKKGNEGSTIFVGNSMPIRDMDTFFLSQQNEITVYSNRGANGIDGVISTALGVSTTSTDTTLMIGDLSFLHDYTSFLLAKKNNLSLRVIVINNNGGGIFSFLPQHDYQTHYEKLFGTPFDAPIKEMIESLDIPYSLVQTTDELATLVERPVKGLEVIEVQTNREENQQWHRHVTEKVHQEVKRHIKGEK